MPIATPGQSQVGLLDIPVSLDVTLLSTCFSIELGWVREVCVPPFALVGDLLVVEVCAAEFASGSPNSCSEQFVLQGPIFDSSLAQIERVRSLPDRVCWCRVLNGALQGRDTV